MSKEAQDILRLIELGMIVIEDIKDLIIKAEIEDYLLTQ